MSGRIDSKLLGEMECLVLHFVVTVAEPPFPLWSHVQNSSGLHVFAAEKDNYIPLAR